MKRIASLLLLIAGVATAQQRIVTVGTSLTETVYALGAGAQVVATDNSSHDYIPQTKALPTVGAFRTVNSEGIVALKPDLFLATVDAGPPEALRQIERSGVKTVVIPRNYKVEEVRASIRQVALLLGKQARGEELIDALDRDLKQTERFLKPVSQRVKVVFCGLGPNMPGGNLSGKNTRISEMMALAGGTNPITTFEGFRPLTEEGLVAASPDVIVMTERSFERAGGLAGVRQLPGVALTPAGRTGRILPVTDMYFQGFGPGLGKAVLELSKKLYPRLRERT